MTETMNEIVDYIATNPHTNTTIAVDVTKDKYRNTSFSPKCNLINSIIKID